VLTDTSVPTLRSHRFAAMGTEAHIALVGGDDSLLLRGEARIRDLEMRWTRFRDTSELSALNRHAGELVVVSPDTVELVTKAIAAWRMTGGRFDPTVGPALVAHGYDRTFAEVVQSTAPEAWPATPSPGPAGIDLLPGVNAVTLPRGVTLDAGGIGKGLAADLTAQLLVDSGADGALVSVGGDLRAIGRPPAAEGWTVTVPDPLRPDRELLRLAIPAGAVATSSRLQRRWQTATGEAHHLIDPHTGRPAQTDVVAVTVVAGEAWWAEALAKALFLAGPPGLDDIGDVHAVVVTADGGRHATPDLEATLR
jgi:thiamine biosynthesis lipoprotein